MGIKKAFVKAYKQKRDDKREAFQNRLGTILFKKVKSAVKKKTAKTRAKRKVKRNKKTMDMYSGLGNIGRR